MPLAQNPSCNPACTVCHYKHLSYPEQLARKSRWASERLGRWAEVLAEIIPAPETERLAYRSKSWLRSAYANGEVSFGMYRAAQIDGAWDQEFVSWDTCPLHQLAIQQTIPRLKAALATGVSPDFLQDSLLGVWVGGPHLVVVSRDECPDEIRRLRWAEILVAPLKQAWSHRNQQVGRKVFRHRPIEPLFGQPPEAQGGQGSSAATHPIRAFRQVAQTLLQQARASALLALTSGSPSLVLDLYCGVGDLALLLPPSVGWVGIELSGYAVDYANRLRAGGPATHAAFVGTVEHRIQDTRVSELVQGPYALYLNPPRPGLSDQARARVMELIRARPPSSVVYLSCSASSLARDLAAFEREGYAVRSLQPYDFFPQTEHFETLAVLGRAV